MTTNVPIELGASVAATDASCGAVLRLVVEPENRVLTHLAVGPRHGAGHLVPVRLLAPTDTALSLSCSVAEFDALASDQDAELVPHGSEPDMGLQTDMVVDSGRRWNRRHRVIPVDAIAHFGISVQLTLTHGQISET